MSNFPTLSVKPDAEGFDESAAIDPTLRSETESGKVLTRKRFTSAPQKWTIIYRLLSNADKILISNFEKSVGYGAGSFTWIHPVSEASYTVRFGSLVKYNLANSLNNDWDILMEIVQI